MKEIFRKYDQSSDHLDRMIASFRHRNKDLVFLVNVEESMGAREKSI